MSDFEDEDTPASILPRARPELSQEDLVHAMSEMDALRNEFRRMAIRLTDMEQSLMLAEDELRWWRKLIQYARAFLQEMDSRRDRRVPDEQGAEKTDALPPRTKPKAGK